MNFVTRRALLGFASAALFALAGCSLFPVSGPRGGSPEAWSAISNGAPIRVAVYVGPGARGMGMFRWMQIMDQAPETVTTYVDGPSISAGALRNVDLIVMPGGNSTVEQKALGPEGQRELKRFIEEGGSYVGTCAGAFLLMNGTNTNKVLGLAPFKVRRGGWGGEAMLQVDYTKEAAALSGIKAGHHTERFHGGPVMDPAPAVPGADFKVMARFACNLHSYSTTNKFGMTDGKLPAMAGAASAVAGTYGKGRVWLFSCHPEYYPDTWGSVKASIKFLTGREITLTAPQRTKGQLSVGWWCKPGQGPESANVARALVRDRDFDVTSFSGEEIERTDLRHVDAFVVPDVAEKEFAKKALQAQGPAMTAFVNFMNRGGKIVTWGASAAHFKPHRNLVVVPAGAKAASVLRALKNAPAPAPRKPAAAKAAQPVRVAAYFDAGVSGASSVRWIKLLSLSPDCAFTPVSAADIRAGALKEQDLLVMPGGSSATQAKKLEGVGRTNVVEFIRNGGAYFGTCAGCYLALSRAADDPYTRLGILPYERQKSPYRGGSELSLRFTDNADLFGIKAGAYRTVRYHGGPVLNACAAVEGADIKEIARYACEGVYAFNTNREPTMLHHPAIVAGTFGKGKIVGCSPHPESYTGTQDIIRGGLRYLTGRAFTAEYPQATRGNLVVGFYSGHLQKDGAQLAADLYREPAIDLRAVDGEMIGYGALEHCDALVVSHPLKGTPASRLIVEFAQKGARVFLFGTAEECAKANHKLPNLVTCTTREALQKALVAYAKEK